jgi:hypothetical protein
MSWFKVEDGFHSHPKVRQAGNAAVGLWLRCATYSAHYLTDGYVEESVARQYGTRREIERLVTSQLWVANGSGFVIPDYLEYNPSAAEVIKRRADWSEAKRAGGEARAAKAKRDAHGHFVADTSEPW